MIGVVIAVAAGGGADGGALGIERGDLCQRSGDGGPDGARGLAEVEDGNRTLLGILVGIGAPVIKGQGGGGALEQRRTGGGKDPDVAQTVVAGVRVAQGVAQDTDQRDFLGFADNFLIGKTAEDGKEFGTA